MKLGSNRPRAFRSKAFSFYPMVLSFIRAKTQLRMLSSALNTISRHTETGNPDFSFGSTQSICERSSACEAVSIEWRKSVAFAHIAECFL